MKIYARLIILITFLILFITIAGCVKRKNMEIEFSIGFKDLNASYPGEQDLKCLIKTFDEWSSLRSQRPYYPDTLDEKYNRQYFKSKSLIVYSFIRGTGRGSTEIIGITKKGSKLQIDVEVSSGYLDAMTRGIIIIEVNKSDVLNISELQIIENFIEKGDNY